MLSPAVAVTDLVIRYGPRTAVNGLTFEAPRGQVTALVGPNGAGKTSTVEACVGLRPDYSGRIELLGVAQPASGADRAGLHARVGVMLQDGGLYSTAKPLELLSYVAGLYPDSENPAALLTSLGIDPATRTTIRRLSGGEQQRVKCALALVGRPDLVFLDEPTAGLDTMARRTVHDLVRGLVQRGTSVVLTTHLMDDVERLADRVVVIARGRAIRHGSVTDLVGDDESISFIGPMHADLTSLRSALPEGSLVTEDHAGHYRVTGAADARVLSVIASWCGQHDVPTSALTVGRRSLEDVIVDLVGDLT